MYEKEKRKREPSSPWLRTSGFAIIFMSLIAAFILPLFLLRGLSPRLLMFLVCGLAVASGMSAVFLIGIRPAIQGRPTLNQIRQNPDNPLIVQQWNGHEWIDTLDMQPAVKNAQDNDSLRD